MIRFLCLGFDKSTTVEDKLRKKYLSIMITGTWIAVSPIESIPEKYKSLIKENNTVRELYKVPEDWRLIQLSEHQNSNYDLYISSRDEIYSIPKEKTIMEVEGFYGDLRWGVASKDLNLPSINIPKILEENCWIEKGGWSLFCIGRPENKENTIKILKNKLGNEIIYEFLI